ncbi:MAG: hypothetical protein AAF809_11135 [Bacteroidota bacterium]
MLLTLLLTLSLPLTAPSTGPDPFEGLYVCTVSHGTYLHWFGDWDGEDFRREYELLYPEDYPIGTKVRPKRSGAYAVRGGAFHSLSGTIDFDTSGGAPVLVQEGTPCTQVEAFSGLITALGLDPTGLSEEVASIEGWTADDTDARLADPAFADQVFGGEFYGDRTLAELVGGDTL